MTNEYVDMLYLYYKIVIFFIERKVGVHPLLARLANSFSDRTLSLCIYLADCLSLCLYFF